MKTFFKIISIALAGCTVAHNMKCTELSEQHHLAGQIRPVTSTDTSYSATPFSEFDYQCDKFHEELQKFTESLLGLPSLLTAYNPSKAPALTFVPSSSPSTAFNQSAGNAVNSPAKTPRPRLMHYYKHTHDKAQRNSVSPYPKPGQLATLKSGALVTFRHKGIQQRSFIYLEHRDKQHNDE